MDASRDLAPPQPVRLSEYRPPDFLIDQVSLAFELSEEGAVVKSRLALRRNPDASDPSAPLRLDGEELELLSVALDGAKLGANRYRIDDDALVIDDVPQHFALDLETRIKPQQNTQLSGLYTSGGNFCTQCEPEGFRRITYFIDRPDVMARFETTIAADAARYPVLLSNGNPVAKGELPGGRHWAKWVDPHPKPSYLFALVAGDLVAHRDSFTTRSGKAVPLAIWVRKGDEDKCGHAMASLKTAMKWDEDRFGREYDLDVFNIVAVSDFNMGAMENKGLNIFNTKYVLAKPETATDVDYQGIESVIAHEYFHNWTGDRVTCRDWFQLSLKEGLTVYRDQEFSADQGSRAVRRIGDVRRLRAAQFPEDAGPLAHPVQPQSYLRIDNFYTATVYNKGAEVVRMIETIVGRDGFRKGMDLYFERHDNHAVTIEDFVAAMQDANGVDLASFRRWYHQAGTPEIAVSDRYDAGRRSYALTLRQETRPTPGEPMKEPVTVPVAMALIGPDGAEVAAPCVLMLKEREETFRFDDVAVAPTPSLFRRFSAPVRVTGLGLERLKFLALHDGDPFNRWESAQQVSMRLLLDRVAAIARGESPPVDPEFVASARAALAEAARDPAFAAELMTLPTESYLADQLERVDVDAIHAAREAARAAIGGSLANELAALYDRLADRGPYRIDGPSIGRRRLRNTALAYLAAEGGEDGVARAKTQFATAGNMTDALAALAVLVDLEHPARKDALDRFYARWQDDALVIDKWFALQAMSRLPSTPARVRELSRHPAYDRRVPNRVRALVSSFAEGNAVRFHDRSGAGYDFLADEVMAIDPQNPLLAARMLQALGHWRRHDGVRQKLMKGALERVMALPGLSKNTFEIASKSLAEPS